MLRICISVLCLALFCFKAAAAEPAGLNLACIAIAKGAANAKMLQPISGQNLAAFYYTKDAEGYLWRQAEVNLDVNKNNSAVKRIEYRVAFTKGPVDTGEANSVQFTVDGGAVYLIRTKKEGNLYLNLTLPAGAVKYRCVAN